MTSGIRRPHTEAPETRSPETGRPVVAVPADLRAADGYLWHAVSTPYLDAVVQVAGAQPVVIPAYGADLDYAPLLRGMDGLLLTGSRSNVHPGRYGVKPTPAYEPFDEARDATTLPLIKAAIDSGIPLFAICRGFQELNVVYGGSIATEIQDLEGREDHRAPVSDVQAERFALRQTINIAPGSRLAGIVGTDPIKVNSLHRQAIDRLGAGLEVEARAEDGTIEAIIVKDAPGYTMGVQWHPEYWATTDDPSQKLFEAFGSAIRAYQARRPVMRTAS